MSHFVSRSLVCPDMILQISRAKCFHISCVICSEGVSCYLGLQVFIYKYRNQFAFLATVTAQEKAAPYECFMGDVDGCNEIIGLWAFGIEGNCLPDEFGFRVGGDGYTTVVFEVG